MHGKFGLLSSGKRAAIVRRYSFFPCVQRFRVSIIHRTLTMDYGIFNVRTFLCVRMHTGLGQIDNESAQHFDSEKLHIVLVCSGRDWNLESIGSRGQRSTNWATTSPEAISSCTSERTVMNTCFFSTRHSPSALHATQRLLYYSQLTFATLTLSVPSKGNKTPTWSKRLSCCKYEMNVTIQYNTRSLYYLFREIKLWRTCIFKQENKTKGKGKASKRNSHIHIQNTMIHFSKSKMDTCNS